MDEKWDIVIVGAGVAGSFCATLLAQKGWNVLLIEKSPWPREKVCGGCLNAKALQLLTNAGLAEVLHGSTPLTHFNLIAGKQRLQLDLPRGAAIKRRDLDANLVTAAIKNGATFRSNTSATLLPTRSNNHRELRIANQTVQARLVLACDGIAGTLLTNETWARWHICPRSNFGISATIPLSPLTEPLVPNHSIGMHLGNGGYVGLARYGTGEMHLAAALSLPAVKKNAGPSKLIERILGTQLGEIKVLGTPLLTRWRKPAGDRVLAVGDACGYVEPFTGEGIAWALEGASAVAELILREGLSADLQRSWEQVERGRRMRRQAWIRVLREVIRHPRAVEIAIKMMGIFPMTNGVFDRIAAHIGGKRAFFERELV